MEVNNINWKDFFQAINHPALILDSSYCILAANKASQNFMGLSEDEIVGKQCFKLLHDFSPEETPFCCPLETLINQGVNESVEMEMEVFGGYALVSCTPIFDENGNLDKIIHITTDITKRKNSEEALKRSESQMSGLISNLPGFVYHCRNDVDWTMEYMSDQCKDITGYDPSDFIDNSELAYGDIIHPEDQKQVWSNVQKSISMNEPFKIQYRIITKDSGVKWVWERGFASKNAAGELFLEGFIEDITARKKAENARKKSERNFRELIENSPLATASYDKKGEVKLLNHRFIELTGYNLEDIPSLEEWFVKVYPNPDYRLKIRQKWVEELEKVKKGENFHPIIATIQCKDGDVKIVEFFGNLIGDNAIAILNDVTQQKKAQNQLKESQQRLNDIIEFLPDATFVIDENSVVISWNHAIEEMTGVKAENMVGKGNYEYALPFYGERRPILIDLVFESDADIQKRYGYIERDGNILLGETNGSLKDDKRVLWGIAAPLYDSEGNYKGSIETIRDITHKRKVQETLQKSEEKYKAMVGELKDAEKALKESERSYRELVDNSLVGIFKTNLDGKILFANDAMAKMFHYDNSKELKEDNIVKVYWNREERLNLLQELRKKGRVTDYEVHAVGKDGQKVDVLLSASMEGNILSGMFMDITDRKKSELKLKESEEQLGAIFNTVKSGIILVDEGGVINFANQHMTELFGFKLSELIGMNYLDLTSAKEKSEAEQSMLTLIKGEIDYVLLERLYQRKDGSVFWGQVSSNRLLNDDGSLKGLIGVVTDISDRREAEDALKDSLMEKEILLREIHHRVKNNMQIISSLLNLQIQFEDLDETVGVLRESQGRVKSMAMVHEKLYRSDSFSRINFKEYLTSLASDIFYSYNIIKDKIGLELDIEDVNVGIDTAIPLGLIINELVTNSVKYAFPEGRNGIIRIIFKPEAESYVLIISDDGVGVPSDIEPGKTETLGLQLVTSLVRQLDGIIRLDRSNGTKYVIEFQELKYKERI